MNRTTVDLHACYDQLADEAPSSERVLASLLRPTSSAPRAQLPATRRVSRIALGGALIATAVTIAVVILPSGGQSGPSGTGLASANAATVLNAAAAESKSLPDVIPRPDQFYYVANQTTELWLSIDGTHDGLSRSKGASGADSDVIAGCRNGISLVQEIMLANVGHPVSPIQSTSRTHRRLAWPWWPSCRIATGRPV